MKTILEALQSISQEIQNQYDFSKSEYQGALKPIPNIQCMQHGVFQQYIGNLRKGTGCPACGVAKRTQARTMPIEKFYTDLIEMHDGAYTYPKRIYTNMQTLIPVQCPEHGEFIVRPLKHYYNKQGCPQCGAKKRGIRTSGKNVGALAAAASIIKHRDLFLDKAKAVHGDKYDYSKAVYTGMKQEVIISCAKHGEFLQRPEKHLYEGQGCSKCGQKSAPEQEVADYLNLFIPIIQRDRKVISPKEIDIYIPTANLAIEFHGMYWHAHLDVESENKDKHKSYDKYKLCADKGIRLITIYESEWEQRKPQIKRLLRNAIGKTKGKLMARKCQVSAVPHTEARAFFERYHPQGGTGAGAHYGIYWKTKLVACMRFSLGSNDRGNTKARDWTLSRYATRVNVLGGASKLFKAFVKEQNPELIKSFSDNRYFSGGMYEQLGFEMETEAMPDYQVWSPKKGLSPKSHYQRRNIQTRLIEHGKDETYEHATDLRTEREMTYLMGAGRIYDCGKKKWVWKNIVDIPNIT